MNESEKIKQILTDYFSQNNEIDTVLLFGSFAKGKYNGHSDIDIAIHSNISLNYDTLSKIQTELSLLTHREIDLSDLSKAEGIFLYQIMTTGIKIKIKPVIFVKYLTKALCFREDFLPAIQYFRKEKLRRVLNG